MFIRYIRADKETSDINTQLKNTSLYLAKDNKSFCDEYIDKSNSLQKLDLRENILDFFRSYHKSTLVINEIEVLSTNVDDLVYIFACLFNKDISVIILSQNITIDKNSSSLLLLESINSQQSVKLEKNSIGRPKGSKSFSKFDIYYDKIINMLKDAKSVSDIARELNISRSSLNDYINSRELKDIYKITYKEFGESIDQDIEYIECPIEKNKEI